MKHGRRSNWVKIIFVISIFAVLLSIFINNIIVNAAKKEDKDITTKIIEQNEKFTRMEFKLNNFKSIRLNINGQKYRKIYINGGGLLDKKGEPELPIAASSIIVTDRAKPTVTVLDSKYRDIQDIRIAPSKGDILRNVDPEDVPYEFGKVYGEDKWYPENVCELGDKYKLRDFTGVPVRVFPFQYNPVRKILRVYSELEIKVNNNGSSLGYFIPEPPVKEFDKVYSQRFDNYEDVLKENRYIDIEEKGELLIITYDAFNKAIQPLVEWKKQKGINVNVVNISEITDTNDSEKIKNYIKDYYNKNKKLCWVLLVGDIEQIASPRLDGPSTAACDPMYSKVAGDDDYPDIFIGRFSAENEKEVETQVLRTIEYEKNLNNDADWLDKGAGIASDSGLKESDRDHMDNIRDKLLSFGYTSIDQLYAPSVTSTDVSKSLNEGRGIVNYCGHGFQNQWVTSGFSSKDIKELSNYGKWPFIISVSCLTGKFETGTCFAEEWLRTTDINGRPIGAVAAYMSTINQPWIPPMIAQNEITDLISEKKKITFGGLCFNGACKMIDTQGAKGILTFNAWTVFGDPSLNVRTEVPKKINVRNEKTITPDTKYFSLEVQGVEGALCSLYADGKNFGTAYTDSEGKALISINDDIIKIKDSRIILTVTGNNLETYTSEIEIK